MDEWVDGRTDGWVHKRRDGWTDGWIGGWMDGWTDGWTDENLSAPPCTSTGSEKLRCAEMGGKGQR